MPVQWYGNDPLTLGDRHRDYTKITPTELISKNWILCKLTTVCHGCLAPDKNNS